MLSEKHLIQLKNRVKGDKIELKNSYQRNHSVAFKIECLKEKKKELLEGGKTKAFLNFHKLIEKKGVFNVFCC